MIPYAATADIIYKVARQLNTSLDLEEVLGKVLHLTVEATGAERGSLFLLDDEGHVTRQIQSSPHKPYKVVRRNIQEVMSHGLAGWVYRHQHGALATDVTTDERWVQLPDSTHETRSALIVPLLRQDTVNGLLSLHHSQKRFFDESHLALAAGIASQAAVAVENARLFTQIKGERESLYMLFNAMPMPVLEIDTESNIIFANQMARQSLQIKEVNIPLMAIEGGNQLNLALGKLHRRAENHIEVHWSDGRVFNVSINDVPQLGTVVALDDITHLKELDSMKSQFVQTVSHDLKNPLAIIMGFAEVLKTDLDLSETGQTCVDSILNNATQMRVLIEELLDLAEIEAGIDDTPESCNLTNIVNAVVTNYSLQTKKKKHTVVLDLPQEACLVQGSSVRLSQVVSNLVSNAVKYTPNDGKINVSLIQNDSEIWLQVADTGPGIPPAAQSQLFQKFYRVPDIHASDSYVKSTGLGLSIVKAITEDYGGRVWVTSEVGVGSTFACVLPCKSTMSTSDETD